MYARMYLNVLNRHGFIYNATTSIHPYRDIGLLCVHASSYPQYAQQMVQAITNQLTKIAKNSYSQEEVRRSKNQLRSVYLMGLEQRPAYFEDVVRQVIGKGEYRSINQSVEMIEAVSSDDLVRVSRKMLSAGPPAICAIGALKYFPYPEQIRKMIEI
ncbi:hypothetical protein ACOME3_006900 [Neoechinorhynchus agilis]